MLRVFPLFLLVLILCTYSPAQTVKIKKIIDSNLFETEDGRVIKLAGLDVPKLNHPDRYLRSVAGKACAYSSAVFLNRTFNINSLSPRDSVKDYELVIIQKRYPLGLFDYNKDFLSQGFGRFAGNVPGAYYNDYRDAEQEALAHERGIWKVVTGGSTEVLDRPFSSEEINLYVQKDSLFFMRNPVQRRASLAGPVVSEVFIGPVAGFLTALPSAYLFAGIGALNKNNRGWDFLGWIALGAGFGYITGNALGVYVVAHDINPNVSFLGTVAASFVGTAGGLGLAAIVYRKNSPLPYIIAFAGPLAGAMVYTNLLTPRPEVRDYYGSQALGLPVNSFSHKELYNSTIVYNLNLFRITF
ncbi:MAG: thermonuclease family protein [Acidobacteriota bacterium]